MPEHTLNEEDRKLLFEVLFDIKALARLVDYVVGGDEDGGEEEEADEP